MSIRSVELMTPGPTNIPWEVLQEQRQPMLHHRSVEFSRILYGLNSRMKKMFQTDQTVLPLPCTGRGGMEAILLNLFSPGDKVVCIANGVFGEMFGKIGLTFGLEVDNLSSDWEKPLALNQIDEYLKQNKTIKGLIVVHNETSTAAENDIKKLGGITTKRNCLLIVDAVSSAGCSEIKFDEWGIDAVVTASQKGLMSPAGMSFVLLSKNAWKACEKSTFPKSYFDLSRVSEMMSKDKPETPSSTPVSIVRSVAKALYLMEQEGFQNVYDRHKRVSGVIRDGLISMGMELFPKEVLDRAPGVTAFSIPGCDNHIIIKEEIEKRCGILIATGLGNYKKSTLRVGHMGNVNDATAIRFISYLEEVLYEAGFIKEIGRGMSSVAESLQRYNAVGGRDHA